MSDWHSLSAPAASSAVGSRKHAAARNTAGMSFLMNVGEKSAHTRSMQPN